MTTYSFRRRDIGDVKSNCLDIAQDAFIWLVTGPDPVSVDGRAFPGLPDRRLPLDEVRDLLLARQCGQATKDAVWTHLVLRSRAEGATWTVAAVGVAMPALTSVAATLSVCFAVGEADIHAEVLSGFLTALSTVDLGRPRIMLRLRWAAYRSGYRARSEALDGPTPIAPGFRSAVPRPPWGHPDLVLARAVAEGVLTSTEADLIGATRLEREPVSDWAARREVGTWAVYKTRKRAELRLVAYLRDEAVAADPADPLVDEVAASLALSRSPSPTDTRARRSLSVSGTTGRSGPVVRPEVSKSGPEDGVSGCGEHPCSTGSSEVPRCA
ncbi:hypothetical protein F4560_001084 [Saccharothrix ecbatanensis]|uniref:Uncharacterized protein n=1 Tax=Saccharothrix ecbatanensis TaxID=1105145 RepID=A0A7W9HG18_9PSEU|nr:hypothetical protein [Saccharothrix ecbatanensis]MBB5801316.1 hypothetical protein [Saccharothrix ecbatanensis]